MLPIERRFVTDELAWETVDRWTAYQCPGFSILHEAVRLPDGRGMDFDYLSEPPAVIVLPLTADEDVIIIEEWRQAVQRANLAIPAGTVEPGDATLKAAARRELREETGYRAGNLEQLLTVEPANGISDSVHHHFVATDCQPNGEQRLDADERIRVRTIPYPELSKAVNTGDVRDGRTVTAVLYHSVNTERR